MNKATFTDGTQEVLQNKATEQTKSLLGKFAHAVIELAPQALQCAEEGKQRKNIENIKRIVEHCKQQ